MPCRFANGGDPGDRTVDEEPFVRSTLVIGGDRAYRAGVEQFDAPSPARDDRVAEGADGDPADFWPHGAGSPEYHLFYTLEYPGDGPPSAADRETVETALAELRAALAPRPEGVLFEVGYSASYFERFGEAGAAVRDRYEGFGDATADDGEAGDVAADPEDPDVLLHVAADEALTLVGVEAALWGGADPLDLDLSMTFGPVFGRPEGPPARRVGIDPTGTASRARDSDAVRLTTLSVDPNTWYVPVGERIEEHVRMHSEEGEAEGTEDAGDPEDGAGPVRADGGPGASGEGSDAADAGGRDGDGREGDSEADADADGCPVDHGADGSDGADADGEGADGHGPAGDDGADGSDDDAGHGGDAPEVPRRGLEGLALPGPTVHLLAPADAEPGHGRASVDHETAFLTVDAGLPTPDAV